MHTSFEDPRHTPEAVTDMAVVNVTSATKSLDEYRDDPEAYRLMRHHVREIEEARDRLTTLVQQIKGTA